MSQMKKLLLSVLLMSWPVFSMAAKIEISKESSKKYFTTGVVYTISNSTHGQELALTLVPHQPDPKSGILASESAVKLMPLKKSEHKQLWQPYQGDRNEFEFQIYSRFPYPGRKDLTFVMKVWKVTDDFSDIDNNAYHDKNNFVTAGSFVGGYPETWIIQKLSNGKFRISSLLGWTAEGINPTWKEQRSLEAYKGPDGKVRLRHNITSDSPAQQWTFTRAGFYPEE